VLISTQLRPEDVVRFNTGHYALAPIAGLQMEEPALQIGDLLLVRCNRAEWESVEHAVAFKDWHAHYYHANPVFLCRMLDQPVPAEQIEPLLRAMMEDAARLILAMRLYQTGPLLEPSYTATFLATSATIIRQIGPYRSEFLAMPIDGRTWPLERGDVNALASLLADLSHAERISDADTLRAAIDQFTLGHVPATPSFFTVHMLLTAIDMLFDGALRSLDLSTTRYERALQILRWSERGHFNPAFETFYAELVHPLRNAIQHHAGETQSNELSQAQLPLQIAVMMGIRMTTMLTCANAAEALPAAAEALGWGGRSARDLLSAGLDRAFRGDPAPFETLVAAAAGSY
jgi:hypothetical protein